MAEATLATLRTLAAAYAHRDPVTSVAVVGNAPMEPSERRAELIDSADLVLRTNSFVVDRGDERCQGRRTDVVLFSRLVPATPDFWKDYPRRLYVLLEPMRMYGQRAEMWPPSWPADAGYVPARNDEVARPLMDELGLPWREQALAPTTGTTAIWLAHRLFPEAEVRVAGISYVDKPDQVHWHHQFGDSVVVGGEHRIAVESALLQRWRAEGRIIMLPLEGEGGTNVEDR